MSADKMDTAKRRNIADVWGTRCYLDMTRLTDQEQEPPQSVASA